MSTVREIALFLKSIPKSYRLAKECRGEKCLSVLDFHIWRWYKLKVEEKLR